MAYGETKIYFDGSHYIAIPNAFRHKQGERKAINKNQNAILKMQFEKLYGDNHGKHHTEKIQSITEELKPHFTNESETE